MPAGPQAVEWEPTLRPLLLLSLGRRAGPTPPWLPCPCSLFSFNPAVLSGISVTREAAGPGRGLPSSTAGRRTLLEKGNVPRPSDGKRLKIN